MAAIVSIPEDSDFPLANIPFGVISTANNVSDISFIAISESIYCDVNIVAELIHIQPEKRCATRIGDHVVDLAAVAALGLFDGPKLKTEATRVFAQPTLNEFMRLGRAAWQEARAKLQTVLAAPSTSASVHTALVPLAATTVHLPAHIGDYTDFYSSREHAFNVGVMFRGRDNALQPNYLRLPVGYHGRASSIVLSGTSLSRPCGLIQDPVSKDVFFSESKKLDYELETAFFIGAGNSLGDPIAIDNAEDHIFGMVLMNDWSARDIQAFEYVPLGPFLGKNFGTTISPWIVTLDALEPFRVPQPIQDPAPAAYLKPGIRDAYDIQLHATLTPKHSSKKYMLSKTNFKYLYWTMKQQLAHHTVNGCNMLPGDLLGSGTISGPDPTSLGSLLEASLNGKQDVILSADGSVTRRFIEDGDSLSITGKCEKVINGKRIRIGFGVCEGTILPAKNSQQANANLASKPSRVRSNDPFGLDFGDSSSELNEADFGDLENDAALLAELEGLTREMGLPPSNKVANSLQRVSKPEPKPAPKQQQLQLQQPLKLPVPVDLNGHVEVSIPIFSEEDDNDADAEVDLTEADLNDPDLLNELAEVAGISHEHEESEGKNNKLADLMSDMIMGPSSISATVNQITPNLAHTKQQKIIESNTEKIPLLAPELAANPIVEPASVYSLADIKKRQQEYKQAALAFKKTGDAARAREMLVISKSMQETIDFAELGSSLIPASYRLPSVPPSVPLSPATPPIATKQTAPPPDQNKQSTRHNTSAVPKQSQTPISMPTQSIQQSHQSTPTTKTAITSTPTTATITSTPAISITTLPALQNLINSLKSQIETCTQIAHYNLKNNRKDTAVVYHKLKKQYMSDTQILETMAASGYTTATIPVFPAARYDVVRYEIEAINADIGADEIEVCVVRAYDLNPKNIAVAAGGVTNLADVETYVAFDGGVEGVKGQSAVCKGVDPEYGFLRRCGGVKRGDRAVVRHFERKKIVFDVWVQGKGWGMGLFAGKAVQLGRANLNFAPLLNGVELHEIVDIADAANPRRLAGGKLEVKLRIRTPILKPSILTKEERWVAVDFSGNLNNNPSPTTSVSNVAVDVASEQPSPSPSSEIISSRRETPILPQQTVPQKSAGIPISTPKKAVADIDELELEFHNPDTIASNNVLEAEHTAIVAQITSYKAAMKPVPEDLGDRKSAYDLRMNMLITSVQTGTLTMDAYIASVKTCIATTKKQAFAFKDAGKLELTKQALTRIKIMTDEVQEVEAAMASGEL